MTHTPEQLRRDAIAIERMHGETLTVEWRGHQASQLRAHADALEELERLRVQLAGCGVVAGCNTRQSLSEKMPTPDAYGYSASLLSVAKCVTREMNERERAERLEAELAKLRQHAEAMAYCCEALEMALTKAASIYAARVTLNIGDFLPLTKAYVSYRTAFPKE